MMAETILYKIAAEILKSLGSLAAQQVGSIYGLANELHKLSTTVSSLQAVLIDAQEQQGTSHEDWIMRLKKVFFEADDLLDDFATEVTHRKLVDKVGIFFSKSNPMLYNLKISHRLKAIRQNLDLIAKDKASLNLVERRQPLHFEPNSVQLNLDRETYSFVPDGEVIGRNDDKKEIVDFLLDSEAEENVVVISIIGLGGLGKTTLAQWVYNDEMVKENFDKRLWVCVSDVFEVKMIAEKIVESAGGERANYLQLDAVQKELKEMLDGKKYLLVSYNHLPQHLKICFAYCSLFPKDFVISKLDLIDMWIAQGFIHTTSNTDNVEEVANSYFTDLLRRSFFQETEEHEWFPHSYKMHDLIHDLAKEVADGEFFSITKIEDTEVVPEQTLHASCLFHIDGSSVFPSPFYRKHMKLRTFIYLNDFPHNSTLERMISSFKCLRVLYLRKLQIKFLPQSLGGLKHLRYLAISSKSIVTLPNSITKLHNLQVLKLAICTKLEKLPRDIWRLVSLRHLVCRLCHSLTHIPPGLWQLANLMHLEFTCFSLEDMPPGIGQLTSLRTLTSFIIGKESCISDRASDRLNELKSLVDLRHSLSIKFMGRAHAIGERIPTDVVKRMKHLRHLFVEFEYGNHDDTGTDLIMLEALQPHQNIESLEIHNYRGARFPSWLMVENLGFLLPKLDCLYIRDCHKCQKLPPLWKLPSLRSLVLRNLDFVENIDGLEGDDDKLMLPSNTPTDERYFSSLKQLELEKISEKLLKQILCPPHHLSPLCNLNDLTLVSVDSLVTMPEDVFKSLTSLQSLSIRSCRTLVSLSTCLTHLTSLEFLCIEACPLLDLSNEEAMQFQTPGNLTTFRVLRLDKLMTLPVWLQHFSGTLKSIAIWDCHNFTTIPEWIGDLISLNCLKIDGSPMLTSLPEGMRSLAALQMLIVERGSSILKQRCQKEVGEDWPKIAHIPGVYIRE